MFVLTFHFYFSVLSLFSNMTRASLKSRVPLEAWHSHIVCTITSGHARCVVDEEMLYGTPLSRGRGNIADLTRMKAVR